MTGWILALLISLFNDGVTGIITWSKGAVVLFVIGLPIYFLGAVGGADVKMFSVIGAFLGIDVGVTVFIIAFVVGALISVLKMMVEGNLISRLRHLVEYLRDCIISGEIIRYEAGYEAGGRIHFMLPIMIAVLFTACIV